MNWENYWLSWQAAEDNTPGSWVVAYNVYQNGELLGQVFGTKMRIVNLPAARAKFEVKAVNASGTEGEAAMIRG